MANKLSAEALSILVVDDELSFVEAATMFLANAGYHVVGAPDAEDAVRALEREAFDVAFIDLRMPGMSGVELMERIKERWPGTEVVVISAYASLESAIHAIRKDAFDFLLKPLEHLNNLTAVAERVAEKKRMAEDKRRLVEQLRQKNAEINLLIEWGHSLSDSLIRDDVQRAAVAGLSALAGGAPTALFMKASATELAGVAAHPKAPAGENVIEIPDGIRTAADLAASAEIRRAAETRLGHPVRMMFPLPLGATAGLLVLGEPAGDDAGVGDDTLNHYAGQVTTALARSLAYENISESTYRDALTGLYNNRYLRERLVDEIARSRRYSRPLSLLFLDIDGFKGINDTHGHLVGDSILVAVSNIIRFDAGCGRQTAPGNRASDVPVRYGGDEFVLLLPETGREGARVKAERVREAVASCCLDENGEQLPTTATVSIGVAEYPADADSSAALIDAADQALYKAKRAGRNCVILAGRE